MMPIDRPEAWSVAIRMMGPALKPGELSVLVFLHDLKASRVRLSHQNIGDQIFRSKWSVNDYVHGLERARIIRIDRVFTPWTYDLRHWTTWSWEERAGVSLDAVKYRVMLELGKSSERGLGVARLLLAHAAEYGEAEGLPVEAYDDGLWLEWLRYCEHATTGTRLSTWEDVFTWLRTTVFEGPALIGPEAHKRFRQRATELRRLRDRARTIQLYP